MNASTLPDAEHRGAQRGLIDRTFAVLDVFRRGAPQQSLSELARRTGLPIATTHRLTSKLTEVGALERGADGRYRIGLKLWEIGELARRPTDLRHIARPFMHGLSELTRYSVQLAIREGRDLVSVEHLRHPAPASAPPRRFVGRRFALHTTAIGQVLLAYAPEDVREEILAGPLRRASAQTCVDPDELRRRLECIRRRSYAVSDRRTHHAETAVAAPVRDPAGGVIAALSVSCAHERAARERLAIDSLTHAVRLSASGISRALGA